MKKIFALAIAVLMIVASMSVAMAEPTVGNKLTYTGSDATTNGNIAIKNATKDVTYTLYKIFDATYAATDSTKVAYTASTAVKNVLTNSDYFTFVATADSNKWTVTRTMKEDPVTETKKTDAELITYLKGINTSNFTNMGAIKSNVDGKIEWDKIPYGYYIIVPDNPTENAVVTIDTNNPTVEVVDKNQTVTFEKYITDDAGTAKIYVNEAGLAEDVPFKIEVNGINYDGEDKVFKYRITDTLENGWTLKNAPVVKVGDTTINVLGDTPANGAGYTLTYYKADGTTPTTTLSEAQKFVIDVRWTQDGTKDTEHLYGSNEKITVTYTADLDATKIDAVDVGGTTAMQDGNRNTAKTEYFKGNDSPDSTTPSGQLGEQKTETFTTELTILKKDQDGNALEGAEFTLTGPTGTVVVTTKRDFTACESTDADAKYWKLKDGTYTTDDPNTTGMDQTKYESTTQMYKETKTTQIQGAGQTSTDIKMTVGKDGKVTFTGLRDGAYTLKETKVPDGYNGIEPINFTITCTITKSQSEDKWTVAYTTNNQAIQVETNNKLKISITNNKGVELPSTGGIGTTIFYVAGSILVLAAAILLITKRRMSSND